MAIVGEVANEVAEALLILRASSRHAISVVRRLGSKGIAEEDARIVETGLDHFGKSHVQNGVLSRGLRDTGERFGAPLGLLYHVRCHPAPNSKKTRTL